MGFSFNSDLRNEYEILFDSCVINPQKYPTVDNCVDRMTANKSRYEALTARVGVPWYFTAIIHNLECSCNFATHLHNGDPLTSRTVHVPRGYPKTGTPPFSWEESAEDALRLEKLDSWNDWSIPGILYKMEEYNGFGYRPRGIHSPYLWSYSNHYTKGKFTEDGRFDPNAISKQIGAAVLLRRLSERQLAVAGEIDTVTLIKKLGTEVIFDPGRYSEKAERLQTLLNSIGQTLRIDGKAGEKTSDAYKRVSGKYLKGDLRRERAVEAVPA